MKRLFLIIMVLSLVLSVAMTVHVFAESPTISLIGMGGEKGNIVDVRVSVSDNPGMASLSLKLEYDSSALIIYDIEDTGLFEGANHGYDAEEEGFLLSWEEGGSGNGALTVITFMITGAAENKVYSVSASGEGVNIKSGAVSVTEGAVGDATGDGVTDEDDAKRISGFAAGHSGNSSVTALGDVNGDGKVGLLDAIIIARSVSGIDGYTINGEREPVYELARVELDYEE